MSRERDRRLGKLLELALDLPAAARRAALLAACDDPVLVAEALTLVSQQDELGDFLEHSAYDRLESSGGLTPSPGGPISAGAAPGDRIGRYTLLEILGEGGMGQVFLARQTEPVERRVALKLVRGSLASAEGQGRLLAERRALARLHHPNVAHLFDAATTADGRPYFVMELVEGPPLTEYCDRHRLDLTSRLELFAAVCQGVQHAHQKQLLHRDLKPSNILVAEVDGRPVPKIIDFGIAKALDQPLSDEPMTGDRAIGTPSYMSPEALTPLGQDLDTRTDIYALGVLLHELLIGCRPFAEVESVPPAQLIEHLTLRKAAAPGVRFAALDPEEREEVARERGTRVGALRHRLLGDLDAIVLKALARQREDRYATAAELGADVERYLRHEPVLAHPGGLAYTLGRLLRRHRLAAALGGTAVAGVAAAVMVTSLALVEARRSEEQALDEVAMARQQVADADTARAQAEEALHVLAELSGVEDLPVLAPTPDTGGVGETRVTDPLVRAQLAEALGEVQLRRGHPGAARSLLEIALAARTSQLPAGHRELTRSFALLGEAEAREGRLEEAQAHLRRAFEMRRETLAPGDPLLAASRAAYADVLHQLGRFAEAKTVLEDAEPPPSETPPE